MIDGDQPKYAGVCCGDRIVSYSLILQPGTSLEQARIEVALEMPDDATPGELVDKGECTMQIWESPTLSAELGTSALASYFLDDPDYADVILSTAETVEDYEC